MDIRGVRSDWRGCPEWERIQRTNVQMYMKYGERFRDVMLEKRGTCVYKMEIAHRESCHVCTWCCWKHQEHLSVYGRNPSKL